MLFQLLAKHSSALLPCKRFVNKRLNTYRIRPLHYNTQVGSFTIIKLFSMFNTRAKMNNIKSTRPVSLSMNELTGEYWNSYVI